MAESRQKKNEQPDQTDRLISFLKDARSYPHDAEPLKLIQTHISCVALAGDYVYKLKKPVELGFVDYSTLEKRRHFAKREIELNRRLCSKIYLDVVTIMDDNGHLRFGDAETDGRVVDCAVKMQRLDERCLLSHQLEHGEATAGHMDRIIRVLAPFYGQQNPPAEVLENGRPERVWSVVEGTLDEAAEGVGRSISPFAYRALHYFNHLWFNRHRGLLLQRMREQRIMDGHGDLRPEHISFGSDTLCIFDCIEFNDSFRYIDVAADCAFLAMELDLAGRPELSRHFINGMADALGDQNLRKLMDFYKCYRAMVRARVEFLRSREEEVTPGQREASRESAGRYAQLALSYALAPAHPMVLVVMGRIGTGKSTIARHLAEDLGWPVLSSDRLRKQLAGLPLHERPPAEARDRLYDHRMTARVYNRMFEQAMEHAARHQSVILDATFARPEVRDRLRVCLDRQQVSRAFVELQAPDEVIRNRLRDRADRSDVISDARIEDFMKLSGAYEEPDKEEKDVIQIGAEQSVDHTLEAVGRRLVESHVGFS